MSNSCPQAGHNRSFFWYSRCCFTRPHGKASHSKAIWEVACACTTSFCSQCNFQKGMLIWSEFPSFPFFALQHDRLGNRRLHLQGCVLCQLCSSWCINCFTNHSSCMIILLPSDLNTSDVIQFRLFGVLTLQASNFLAHRATKWNISFMNILLNAFCFLESADEVNRDFLY